MRIRMAACALAAMALCGPANGETYSVEGNFENAKLLTGSIDLNPDDGTLLSLDLHANGVMPPQGGPAWTGAPMNCGLLDPTCGFPRYTYGFRGFTVIETHDAATQDYRFIFNGTSIASLDLFFTLATDGQGTITGGRVWDDACSGSNVPACSFTINGVTSNYNDGVSLVSGTLTALPLPPALPLFAAGLGFLGLLARRKNSLPKPGPDIRVN